MSGLCRFLLIRFPRCHATQRHISPPKDAALRDDVHAFGHLVGEVLQDQCGPAVFTAVEGDRQAAIGRREGDAEDSVALVVRTQGRPPAEALELIRRSRPGSRS